MVKPAFVPIGLFLVTVPLTLLVKTDGGDLISACRSIDLTLTVVLNGLTVVAGFLRVVKGLTVVVGRIIAVKTRLPDRAWRFNCWNCSDTLGVTPGGAAAFFS